MAVFNNGYWNDAIILIPAGGHIAINSIDGHRAECKKAQKKPKKSIISDTIKSRKPLFNPDRTTRVCSPKKVASFTISLNQWKATNINNKVPNKKIINPYKTRCI